jgi:acyl-CoA oxidase
MLHSEQLKNNPNLYVFLPLLYTVWSDRVLTPSEFATLDGLIRSQSWLSSDDRDFLLRQLDPSNPPEVSDLYEWREAIKQVVGTPGTRESLTDLGMKLVGLHGNGTIHHALESSRSSLDRIEATLGFISQEIVFHFQEAHDTITSQLSTQFNFDVDTLANLLEGDQADVIRNVKTILCDPEFTYTDPGDLEKYRQQVLQWLKYLAERGLGSIAYPKEYGGRNDMAAYFAVMETLSYHDLSLVVKFGVQFGLWGMSVYFLGTEKHHRKYLHDIGTLALPGCFAMTETNHGSNVRGIETTATYQHHRKTFIIHTPHKSARKEYIGNAALHGRMATVFAKLIIDNKDYGVSAFLVPLREANGNTISGVTIEDCGRKMGLNGVDNGLIEFNQVEIPKENMLDRFAGVDEAGKFTSPIASDNRRFFTMLGTLVGGRIGIPRSGIAACKSGLTIAIRYGDQRRQFGPEGGTEVPILNYRTHQRRLMPLLATTYALHFALQHLTKRFLNRTEEDMQEIEAMAAGLKAYATWHTTQTLQECRECCGGKGYLSENRIDALKNDTDIYTTFEGDNTVLMQLVAKSRLTEFKQEFSNMTMFTLLNYVADQARTSITELNPIIVRNTDEEHLLDPEFHLNAFRYRERDILTSAARRLKRHIDSGMDSFDAFNVCQHHLVEVGFAYVDRIVLEEFQRIVKQTEDRGCRNALKKLCDLYALSSLEKHKAWYLEQGYMEGVKTKAIRKLVNQLCWEIRQDAIPLVNAFNIPDQLLGAPIAVQ